MSSKVINAITLVIIAILPLLLIATARLIFAGTEVSFGRWLQYLIGISDSSFGASYLGALGGGVGGYFASVEHMRRRRLSEASNTMIQDFLSPEVIKIRRKAEIEWGNLPAESRSSFETIFHDDKLATENLRIMLGKLEVYGSQAAARELDIPRIKATVGPTIGYWFKRFENASKGTNEQSWKTTKSAIEGAKQLI